MGEGPDSQAALAALAQFYVHDGTVGDTLLQVAELACHAAHADMAGITMLLDGKPGTGVFTDPEAPEIDRAQYDDDHGPCLHAFRTRSVIRIDSTEEDPRWPEFAELAASHGIKSTLSIPVTAREEPLAALNLYSRAEANFDEADAERMGVFATHAAFVLANVQLYWDSRQLSENLNEAMRSRATIEHAIGVILASGGRTPDEAFQVLVRASQRTNRKLRDVAAELVERASKRRPI